MKIGMEMEKVVCMFYESFYLLHEYKISIKVTLFSNITMFIICFMQ